MTSPNLYTAADGLFGTHVTWDDIELDMQEALGTKAVFGAAKIIRDIGGGQGFLSRVCLIEPDWQPDNHGENLPRKFVAKLSTGLAVAAAALQIDKEHGIEDENKENRLRMMEKAVRTAHNREVSTYEQFDGEIVDKIPCTKIYASRVYSEENPLKGYLLMGFIEDVTTVHSYHNLKPETLRQALRSLATIGAASLRFDDTQRSKFTCHPLSDMYETFLDDVTHRRVVGKLRAVEGGEELERIIDRFEKEFGDGIDIEYYNGIGDRLGKLKV